VNVIQMVRKLQDDPREDRLITTTAAMVEAALKPLTAATESRLAGLAKDVLRLVE
jgi:hypothetical protein